MKQFTHIAMMAILFSMVFHPAFGQNYQAMGWNHITQGNTLGPPKGLTHLVSINPTTGAWGCALKLAKTDPEEAANIMIAIANSLITFGINNTQTRAYENPRDPLQPIRGQYYQKATQAGHQAAKFLIQLSRSDPDTASQKGITIATLFYNNIPTFPNDPFNSIFREKARWFLHSSNSESARAFAQKVKNKVNQNTLLNRINGLKKTWKI